MLCKSSDVINGILLSILTPTRDKIPKPKTKETAIVMLADSVEAAVRSLENKSPAKIEGMVRDIVRSKLEDGQLDESDLKFTDLQKIIKEFTRVLTSMYHSRVRYPEEGEKGA